MKKIPYKVIRTEILDFNIDEHLENALASAVGVLVTIKIDNKDYTLEFQTSNTLDYGAISSDLFSYDGNSDHLKLENIFDDKFEDFLKDIKQEAAVNKVWEDYIAENYVRDEEHFGGMDANSERDEMKYKD